MNRIPSLLALMLGTLAAACAAPAAHRPEPANTDFVYIGTAVGDFRVERHQDRSVRSDKIEAAPRDVFATVADVAPLNLSILTRVEPDGPDRSRVTTTVSASARATHGATAGQTACSTTGILEGLIAAIAADRVVAH